MPGKGAGQMSRPFFAFVRGDTMTINLYNISDDPRKIVKTLGTATALQCELVYPSDLLNPTIRISATNWSASLNYMYIPDFARYYYITEVTYENGGAVTIQGRVDPLMSYSSSILGLSVNVVRQETGGLTNIVDNQITVTPKQDVSFVKSMATPFNIRTSGSEINFCLCVAGGAISGGE